MSSNGGAMTPSPMGDEGSLSLTESNRSASAAAAQAMVMAKFMRADARPRSMAQVRTRLMDDCKRPGFAEAARYSVPRGGGHIRGWSIRFAEAAIRHMGNVATIARVIHDDAIKRIVQIEVIDLETNTSHDIQAVLMKTTEKRKLRNGEIPISERVNSTGELVYLVAAREDELVMKQAALVSKALRTCGLRLMAQDILDECLEVVNRPPEGETLGDRIRKACDRFAQGGIPVTELEKHLGHSMDDCTAEELADLWGTFQAIRDGETTWAAITETSGSKPESTGSLNVGDLAGAGEAGEPATDPEPAGDAPEAAPGPPIGIAKKAAKKAAKAAKKASRRRSQGGEQPPTGEPGERLPDDDPDDVFSLDD